MTDTETEKSREARVPKPPELAAQEFVDAVSELLDSSGWSAESKAGPDICSKLIVRRMQE
eukprot:CAMPEP_0174345584 /NCGR_PEP_ID=MMETSP0811_2-20130205/1098_1 /TAXON_ID=73025 ORGANISM="Eutreptiella gymnastica-like, Strain CCMP1594" /NCGR_SAMPLE_ID=MMETSP0811_2 /ASSEMBLY_ACC=CAM_ASM_000667 /LENGTH=59 /DNA_ID=CAMNT_0015469435 /DNA_START=35 /DNA_END=214 /DNA_ORIENTATION=+